MWDFRRWSLNRALVRCPDLRVIAREPEAEALLRAQLVFWRNR